MLEHAIGFNLVEWRLKEAFFLELIIIIILERGKLLCLKSVSHSTCVHLVE